MFFNLTGCLTASRPPASITDGSRPKGGVAHGGDIPYGSRWTPPASPTAIAHSDIAAGFSSSVTSQVAGPSGYISHTAVAVDPVYCSQFTGLASIDNTQADWQAATLTGGHGSSGMGEVCAGMAPTALTGQWGQPADTAGQPNLGDDTALTGQSSQQWLASMGILSWNWRWSRPQPAPLSPPALPDQMGISLPGTSYLTGSGLSLVGVEPPPGFTGTPMGAGELSGSGQMPAVRQVPPLHSGGNQPLPKRTTATIASHTAPKAVTMAGYGGVSTQNMDGANASHQAGSAPPP